MRKGKQAMLAAGTQTIFCSTSEQEVAYNMWALDRNLVITALMVGEASLIHHQSLSKKAMFDSALAAVETFLRYNYERWDRSLT